MFQVAGLLSLLAASVANGVENWRRSTQTASAEVVLHPSGVEYRFYLTQKEMVTYAQFRAYVEGLSIVVGEPDHRPEAMTRMVIRDRAAYLAAWEMHGMEAIREASNKRIGGLGKRAAEESEDLEALARAHWEVQSPEAQARIRQDFEVS